MHSGLTELFWSTWTPGCLPFQGAAPEHSSQSLSEGFFFQDQCMDEMFTHSDMPVSKDNIQMYTEKLLNNT